MEEFILKDMVRNSELEGIVWVDSKATHTNYSNNQKNFESNKAKIQNLISKIL